MKSTLALSIIATLICSMTAHATIEAARSAEGIREQLAEVKRERDLHTQNGKLNPSQHAAVQDGLVRASGGNTQGIVGLQGKPMPTKNGAAQVAVDADLVALSVVKADTTLDDTRKVSNQMSQDGIEYRTAMKEFLKVASQNIGLIARKMDASGRTSKENNENVAKMMLMIQSTAEGKYSLAEVKQMTSLVSKTGANLQAGGMHSDQALKKAWEQMGFNGDQKMAEMNPCETEI